MPDASTKGGDLGGDNYLNIASSIRSVDNPVYQGADADSGASTIGKKKSGAGALKQPSRTRSIAIGLGITTFVFLLLFALAMVRSYLPRITRHRTCACLLFLS